MHLQFASLALLALWTLDVSAAALRARSTPLQDDCNLPEGDPQGADCNLSSVDVVVRRSTPLQDDCNLPEGDPQGLDCNISSVDAIAVRQDLPLGLTSITVGTGTTPSGSTISLTLPYSANLNPSGPLSGAGTLVLSLPISSANLVSGDVSQSSGGAFSDATCDFYASSASVAGLVACTGDVVGSGSTNSEVSLSAQAACVACSYTTGQAGSFNE